MADENLVKMVHKTFDIYGLTITRKLSAIVAKHLQSRSELDPKDWLTKIVEQILTQKLSTPRVDIEHLRLALAECLKPQSTLKETETTLNVIDVFTVPKVGYDIDKKKYILQNNDYDLFSDASYKSLVFKDRLDLLWYRTQKHSLFSTTKFERSEEKKSELVPLDYLLSESKTRNVCVMGLLAQLTEGQYYLEDYGGSVKLNLKDTKFDSHLIMEGSIVIARGKYVDGFLHVENMDFPPAEPSENSRTNFNTANTFGGPHPTSLKFSEKLSAYEKANKNDYLIFVSEVWVDSEIVLNKFKILLSGYSENPPIAIVLCGHFSSSLSNVNNLIKLKEGFKKLGAIVTEFPLIQQYTMFIFVPGPYDLCAPKILPRPPLPKYLMEDFLKFVPNTKLATNPCRIQYCTKEIVVFRENMISKLCRNTLSYPKPTFDENGYSITESVHKAFAKSIIRQSHLTPLLFSVIPVYWKHDHALQLYPTPDLVVVADDFKPYETTYYECKVINCGSFVKSNFTFMTYYPSENGVDECILPEDII
ncbi:DNA polymerase epsilon subunit 2 [Phymastichus coffea]|uniref:DNA polymerase epsilon subunit 2 n=1 Tax=Phymastichus coffea TaxID=108790 RepID=UPI00273B7D3B|nr:DNA polymerase epsilon subunit 2 [Phymastichus coffea]